MKYNWIIWKPTTEGSQAFYIPVEDLPQSGFRSVYQFTEADAKAMERDGYARWKGSVWSPELFIDIDKPEEIDNVCNRLELLGIAFNLYSTGNRGAHLHIPRECEPSHRLPEIDKQFASSLGSVDLHIYHSVAMYRCIGAKHKATGERKELLDSRAGNVLDLRESKAPIAPKHSPAFFEHNGMQSVFTSPVLQLLAVPWAVGERHAAMVRAACELRRLGQSYEFSFGYLQNVSLMAEEPKSDEEINKILNWAWAQ